MKIFTKQEYREAIEALKLGMTQLRPDGRSCAICEDTGHQAWECHHNPLLGLKLIFYFRCYHCGKVFEAGSEAEEHFGERGGATRPVCEHLCSGYGVFPDGRKCEGCLDCQSFKEKNKM